jgi:hypothetical protein
LLFLNRDGGLINTFFWTYPEDKHENFIRIIDKVVEAFSRYGVMVLMPGCITGLPSQIKEFAGWVRNETPIGLSGVIPSEIVSYYAPEDSVVTGYHNIATTGVKTVTFKRSLWTV